LDKLSDKDVLFQAFLSMLDGQINLDYLRLIPIGYFIKFSNITNISQVYVKIQSKSIDTQALLYLKITYLYAAILQNNNDKTLSWNSMRTFLLYIENKKECNIYKEKENIIGWFENKESIFYKQINEICNFITEINSTKTISKIWKHDVLRIRSILWGVEEINFNEFLHNIRNRNIKHVFSPPFFYKTIEKTFESSNKSSEQTHLVAEVTELKLTVQNIIQKLGKKFSLEASEKTHLVAEVADLKQTIQHIVGELGSKIISISPLLYTQIDEISTTKSYPSLIGIKFEFKVPVTSNYLFFYQGKIDITPYKPRSSFNVDVNINSCTLENPRGSGGTEGEMRTNPYQNWILLQNLQPDKSIIYSVVLNAHECCVSHRDGYACLIKI
jgi:hypothetical protein